MNRSKIFLSFCLFFCFLGVASAGENITMATFYPSPYGMFTELRAIRTAIGNNYYDNSQFCWDGACGTLIDANADLVIEGNVGIGTVNPTSSLDVTSGNIKMSNFCTDQYLHFDDILRIQSDWMIGYEAGGSDNLNIKWDDELLMTIDNETGRIGIGTDSPHSKIHIQQDNIVVNWASDTMTRPQLGRTSALKIVDSDAAIIMISQDDSAVSSTIQFTEVSPAGNLLNTWAIWRETTNKGGDLSFSYITKAEGDGGAGFWHAFQTKVVLTPSGNLGIGTLNPGAYRLNVDGSAYSSVGWDAPAADYAEWFEKEEDSLPGDIIGINMDTGKARKYRPGDKFIGIHSKNPAFEGNRLKKTDEEMAETHTLVGLLGQLDFNRGQVLIENRIVKTEDNKEIGVILSNEKILIGR